LYKTYEIRLEKQDWPFSQETYSFALIWKKWKMRQRPKPFCFLERAMGIETIANRC